MSLSHFKIVSNNSNAGAAAEGHLKKIISDQEEKIKELTKIKEVTDHINSLFTEISTETDNLHTFVTQFATHLGKTRVPLTRKIKDELSKCNNLNGNALQNTIESLQTDYKKLQNDKKIENSYQDKYMSAGDIVEEKLAKALKSINELKLSLSENQYKDFMKNYNARVKLFNDECALYESFRSIREDADLAYEYCEKEIDKLTKSVKHGSPSVSSSISQKSTPSSDSELSIAISDDKASLAKTMTTSKLQSVLSPTMSHQPQAPVKSVSNKPVNASFLNAHAEDTPTKESLISKLFRKANKDNKAVTPPQNALPQSGASPTIQGGGH